MTAYLNFEENDVHQLIVMDESDEVTNKQLEANHENWLGNMCFINDRDEELAKWVLEKHLSEVGKTPGVEPVLHDDESPCTSNMADTDILAQIIEMQIRMENGMDKINELKKLQKGYLQTFLDEYMENLARFREACKVRNAFEAKGGDFDKWRHKQLWFDVWNLWKTSKETYYQQKEDNVYKDILEQYWDLWWLLNDMCQELVNGDKSIWHAFFEIEDKDKWLENYLSGEEIEISNEYDCKKPNKETDNRMLESDEAYFLAHREEEERNN